MKEKEKEKERRRRDGYVSPEIEVYAVESGHLLGRSLFGDHIQAEDGNENDHERAGDGGEINGAKQMILGHEFSFSDLWDE